jgi:multidrug efflux pump subunit AcrA (membrane-fusion protein)
LTQQEGETVAAGLSAPTLIEVCALDKLQINASVDETDIGKIQLGQDASVTVDAFPKEPFKGKVTKISSAATMQQNVVTYQVTVKLDSYPVGELKPQMTATTEITLMEKVNVVLAPNEALKQGSGGTQSVVMTNGKPDIRTVETGLTDGSFTEVTSGLKEGDTVVLAGFDKLGIQGFGSAAGVPGFLTKGPLGTGGGGKGGGK